MAIRPKCGSCQKACRKNQKFLACHLCKVHFHQKCSSLTLSELRNLKVTNNPFYCKSCCNNAIPLLNADDDTPELSASSNDRPFDDINLEPGHLNDLFRITPENDESNDKIVNSDSSAEFKPIQDKYFSPENVSFEDFNYASNVKANDVSNNFSSIGVNMRSLANTKNFAKLESFLNSLCFSPTVIAVNETYLKDNESGPHCNLLDYNFISNCRTSHRGGGVGIYVKNFLNYKIRDDLTVMDEKIFESIFIEIKIPGKSILYGTIYRSPSSDAATHEIFSNYLQQCLTILDKSNKLCFIQGDLNYDLCNIEDNNTIAFSDILFDFSFYPHINMPTRIAGSSATCIDHIWSNVYETDVVSGIITDMIADHMITFQCTDINLVPKDHLNKDLYFSKIDFEKLPSLFNEIKIDDILHSNDPDEAYKILETRITESISACTKNCQKKMIQMIMSGLTLN